MYAAIPWAALWTGRPATSSLFDSPGTMCCPQADGHHRVEAPPRFLDCFRRLQGALQKGVLSTLHLSAAVGPPFHLCLAASITFVPSARFSYSYTPEETFCDTSVQLHPRFFFSNESPAPPVAALVCAARRGRLSTPRFPSGRSHGASGVILSWTHRRSSPRCSVRCSIGVRTQSGHRADPTGDPASALISLLLCSDCPDPLQKPPATAPHAAIAA